MATSKRPYGLRPSHRLGNGSPYSGGFTLMRIASNETTPIFNGDPVKLIASSTNRGHIQRLNTTVTATTVTSSGTPVGVFVGCQYTDPVSGKLLQRHYYPGAIVASDIWAFVVDDPDVVFRVQADEAMAATTNGCNVALIQEVVGNTATGNSGLMVDGSSFATTDTLPFRIVGFCDDPDNPASGNTYPELFVRINTHFHRAIAGVAAS